MAKKKANKLKKIKKVPKKTSKLTKATKSTKSTGAVKQIVTRTMLIGDIAIKYPKAVPVMFKYGMHCIGCGMTAYESLEQGCMAHGMSEEEINEMVDEINKTIAK